MTTAAVRAHSTGVSPHPSPPQPSPWECTTGLQPQSVARLSPCVPQNHFARVLYLRHAKAGSSSVLHWFGFCNEDRRSGRGESRGCACLWQSQRAGAATAKQWHSCIPAGCASSRWFVFRDGHRPSGSRGGTASATWTCAARTAAQHDFSQFLPLLPASSLLLVADSCMDLLDPATPAEEVARLWKEYFVFTAGEEG